MCHLLNSEQASFCDENKLDNCCDGFRMWFIQLAPKENVPAVREFVNVITEGGDYVVFDDLGNGHPSMRREDNYWGYDLVFAKEVDGLYTFRGVFVRDGEKSEPNHLVSKRIATKVRLFGGPPARSLELLDEVDAKGYVRTATVPAKPKGRVRKANGAIMIKCARCGKSFESAAKSFLSSLTSCPLPLISIGEPETLWINAIRLFSRLFLEKER